MKTVFSRRLISGCRIGLLNHQQSWFYLYCNDWICFYVKFKSSML